MDELSDVTRYANKPLSIWPIQQFYNCAIWLFSCSINWNKDFEMKTWQATWMAVHIDEPSGVTRYANEPLSHSQLKIHFSIQQQAFSLPFWHHSVKDSVPYSASITPPVTLCSANNVFYNLLKINELDDQGGCVTMWVKSELVDSPSRDIPRAMHFWSLQNWHLFLFTRSTTQFFCRGHW